MGKSWLTGLIGLCMVAFGTFGIWVTAVQGGLFADLPQHAPGLLSFGLLGFIALMGVWNVAIAAGRWDDDRALVPSFLLAYRDAWRGFTSRKWLLVLVCYVALMNILGELTRFAMQRYYLGSFIEQGMASSSFPRSVLNSLSISTRGTPGYFLPGRGLSVSHVVFGFIALSVLCLLPWISRRLTSLQDESALAPAIRFFRRLILPIGIMALIVVMGRFYLLWHAYSRHAAALAFQTHAPAAVPDWMRFTVNLLTEIFHEAIVVPLFVGGLVGSLQKASSDEPVTADSFLEGSIRTFKPLAGIFLLLYLIQVLLGVPSLISAWVVADSRGLMGRYADYQIWFVQLGRLLAVIFMFVPYALATGAGSIWKALRESIGIWRNCGYNLLSFIAFGVSVWAAILMLSDPLYRLAGTDSSPLRSIPSLIAVAIHSVVITVMAVAVWEIYQQIRAASADEPDEGDATDPVDPLDG